MGEKVLVDIDTLKPDRDYNACLKQCEELGLIETLWHGQHSYGRATQAGINALCCLLQMASNSAVPENILKES